MRIVMIKAVIVIIAVVTFVVVKLTLKIQVIIIRESLGYLLLL
jgi:hypothetical protein